MPRPLAILGTVVVGRSVTDLRHLLFLAEVLIAVFMSALS